MVWMRAALLIASQSKAVVAADSSGLTACCSLAATRRPECNTVGYQNDEWKRWLGHGLGNERLWWGRHYSPAGDRRWHRVPCKARPKFVIRTEAQIGRGTRFPRALTSTTMRFSYAVLYRKNVTAHPIPYEAAAVAAPAARVWVMAAIAVRPLRRPVATIEQMSA